MKFIAKLNKREAPYVISDEVFVLTDGKGEGILAHDNINEKTLEIFTQPQRQGTKILNYTIENVEGAKWKRLLRVFASVPQVYVNYESYGDTVEADDVNELQQAAVNMDADLQAEKRTTLEHRESRANPHQVTKAQVGLGNADNTADMDKRVSTAQQAALDAEAEARRSADAELQAAITEEAQAREQADTILQANIDKANTALGTHKADTVLHLTAQERDTWNDKYTRHEVDNLFSNLETNIDWKEAVETFADIEAAYPKPEDGWTVNVKDTDYTYRYNGTEWVAISANAIPKATQEVDGLLAKEDKKKLDGVEAALDGKASASHEHGSITTDGKIGNLANKAIFTESEGLLTAGTLPVTAGGTGATSKEGAANSLALPTLLGGTQIPAKADLDTYKTVGNYYCPANSTAATLLNCPTEIAFTMEVGYSNGTSSYISQEIIVSTTGKRYYRRISGSTWNAWTESVDTSACVTVAQGGTGAKEPAAARKNLSAAYGLSTSGNTGGYSGWYRIAKTAAGINDDTGRFHIKVNGAGAHAAVTLMAGTCYGSASSTNLSVLQCSRNDNGISKARIVYNTTYANNYAYLEVCMPVAIAVTITVYMTGMGWSLIDLAGGSIPDGYTSKEVDLLSGTLISEKAKLNGNLTLDGSGIEMIRPGTSGNWARGALMMGPDGQEAGIGFHGSSGGATNRIYLGFGGTPYAEASGLTIYENTIKWKGNDIYHAGNIDTEIPLNADLNTYTPSGFYYCPYNDTAKTLVNCPTKQAFALLVEKHSGAYQRLIEHSTIVDSDTKPRMFFRNYYNGVWLDWQRVYTTADKPSPLDIGAAATSHTHNYAGSLSVGGPATTANKLATARTINGTAFDGSANITTSNWGTARTITIGDSAKSVNGSASLSWSRAEMNVAYGAEISAATPATAGWYRIAASPSGIANCGGIFTVTGAVSGVHGTYTLEAGISYGVTNSASITALAAHSYSTAAFTKARIVYHSTYNGNFAYLELYNPNAKAITTKVRMVGGSGWALVSPATAGSVPSGYTSKEITLTNGTVSAAAFAGSGAALKSLNAANISSGTLPLTRGGTGATSAAAARTALGAAAASHTHSYLPTTGITWNDLKGV